MLLVDVEEIRWGLPCCYLMLKTLDEAYLVVS